MPSFKCRDIGMNCGWEASASNVEELMQKIAEHAREAHGITEIPQDLVEKVKSAIKE